MYDDIPNYMKEFLSYMQNIKNRSSNTIREYYYDLRDVFRFLKLYKSNVKVKNITPEMINETDITDLDINFLK